MHLLRRHGIEVRPSWLPFTPWTSLGDVADIVEFVDRHDLHGNVDPVQYTIRLLVPEGSLITELPNAASFLGPYDADRLTYRWASPDPRLDELQTALAATVEKATANDEDPAATIQRIWAVIQEAVGAGRALPQMPADAGAGRPRLTEPWFC